MDLSVVPIGDPMPKNKCYILTKFKLFALTRHPCKRKNLGICAICKKPFQTGDYIVRDGDSTLHATCWPLFRYDSPDEVELEREVDSQLTQNQTLKSQRDLERESRLLKLRNRKEPKIL